MERLKSMVEEALNLWHASRDKLLERVGEYPIPDEFWDLQVILYDMEEELRSLSYATKGK